MTDEEQLRQLSAEVEPPAGGTNQGNSGSTSGASSNNAGSGSIGGGSIGGGSESRATGSSVLSAVNHHVRKRHPSPTLSTASTTSSTSATSEGRKIGNPKFGAASPQSVRKMLALSEPSITRPYQAPTRPPIGPCSLSMALPLPGSAMLQQHHSPSPSPGLMRRTAASNQPIIPIRSGTHERSHSDAALPVDLNAESSSVTSLANLAAMRKSHMSGSATSSDSGGGGTSGNGTNHPQQPLGLGLTLGIGLGIGLGAEMDPGYCTQFDSHSNSSTEVSGHPHLLNHPAGMTESPPVAPRTRVPLYPHGTQGIACLCRVSATPLVCPSHSYLARSFM